MQRRRPVANGDSEAQSGDFRKPLGASPSTRSIARQPRLVNGTHSWANRSLPCSGSQAGRRSALLSSAGSEVAPRDDPARHRIFGFNNPDPSPGSPNYGYELWIVIDAAVETDDTVGRLTFEGGRYAVARCAVPEGDYDVIGQTWQRLVKWREERGIKAGTH